MSELNINSPFPKGVTIIPNDFIDQYMPKANGEFVKIYLYLIRRCSSGVGFGLGTIADYLDCTEKDVLRALRYWAKEGLLELSFGSSKKLTGISFLTPSQTMTDHGLVLTANETSAGDRLASASPSEVAVPASAEQKEKTKSQMTAATEVSAATAAQTCKRPSLTADRVKQLKENEDIKQLLFIAQQYLGKTLSPTETNRILYFYEGLNFSVDLIEYLIEYCVCKGHKNVNYIEKVAFAWKDEGITTVTEAKKASSGYHKDYYTILKALGIQNRAPIEAEIKIMDTWTKEYGFTLDLVTEACTRTVLSTKQPSLQYTDKILQSWKSVGVKSLRDVTALDEKHVQAKSEKTTRKPSKTTGTHFSNFEERSYDYSALENQLLNQ